jgi:GTPase Era involved in 16S rRNA processing
MEQRINEKINNYMISFKTNIRKKIDDLDIDLSKNKQVCELILFIMDYENVVIEQEDIILSQTKKYKKKQSTLISDVDRCCAKKINDEQCSRKKKVGYEYCGSHIKATPFGCCDNNLEEPLNQKIQISMEDIQGIIYYVDKNGNVYHPQDIVNNILNPRIISKYIKNSDNTLTLI